MLVRLLPLLPVAVECLLFGGTLTGAQSAVATANDGEKVEGKVIKCTVDDTIVFFKAAEVSAFSASWEYVEDDYAAVYGWVINVHDIIQIELSATSVEDAKSGKWFAPEMYTAHIDEIDESGTEMQNIFSDGSYPKKVRLNWDSPSAVTIFIELDGGQNVEIEFTRASGRVNLPAMEYFMPTQGNMISLTVDGVTVFDKASSTTTFPVVCTPAFFKVGKMARGLDVNVAGLTWFWVRMSEMQKNGHFSPNSHGYTPNTTDATTRMLEGFLRWRHQTKNDIDVSAELTMRSDANSVEISGNGTKLVFAKEKVEGKVIKCTVGDKIIFEQPVYSRFPASWEFMVDEDTGATGWAINIPTIVQFQINSQSLMESDTAKLENRFAVSEYTVYPDDTENMDELTSVRAGLSGDNIVDEVSIIWDSHKSIKIFAHVKTGKNVEIVFTRGPTAANAEYYDKIQAA